MSPFTENPFAVLTLIVAPAVLTNATSVLSLNTSNRFARVIDRSRTVMAELDGLDATSEIYGIRLRQLDRLQRRATLLIQALTAFYSSLGSFAAAALISLFGAVLVSSAHPFGFYIAAGMGVAAGVFAVGGLVFGCILVVRETRLAVLNLTEEAALAHAHYRTTQRPPAAKD